MAALTLVRPSLQYRDSFLEAAGELPEPDQRSLVGTLDGPGDFATYVGKLLALETSPPAPLVRDTVWWGIAADRFIGRLSFRHELNEYLRAIGGHIGYAVRPSERGKGHASEMLRQALATPLARRVGDVLITCDEDNVASIRVITRNGGVRSGHHDAGDGQPRTLHFRVRVV